MCFDISWGNTSPPPETPQIHIQQCFQTDKEVMLNSILYYWVNSIYDSFRDKSFEFGNESAQVVIFSKHFQSIRHSWRFSEAPSLLKNSRFNTQYYWLISEYFLIFDMRTKHNGQQSGLWPRNYHEPILTLRGCNIWYLEIH